MISAQMNAGANYPMKVESQKLFLEFMDEPAHSPRCKHEGVNRFRDGPTYHATNVGLITIGWTATDPEVLLQAIDVDGAARIGKKITF